MGASGEDSQVIWAESKLGLAGGFMIVQSLVARAFIGTYQKKTKLIGIHP